MCNWFDFGLGHKCYQDLTCGYVMGYDVGRAGHDWFPQIRAMGVQVGFRSRNSNPRRPLRIKAIFSV
jgi:hypothetical protein